MGCSCMKKLGVLLQGVQKASLVLPRVFSLKRPTVRAVVVPIRISGRRKKELVPLTCAKKKTNIQGTSRKQYLGTFDFILQLALFYQRNVCQGANLPPGIHFFSLFRKLHTFTYYGKINSMIYGSVFWFVGKLLKMLILRDIIKKAQP